MDRRTAWRADTRLVTLLILSALVVAGLWLRVVYLRTISLHVDEFISLLAIRGILQHGYPLLPSGTLYEQGLLFSYAEALLLSLFGFDAAVGRSFSLVISLVTIALVYYVGRRMLSRRVGLLAAALLAFSPEAISWGARVRMYAVLQLLVLLCVWFLWRGGTSPNGARYRWLGILCYLGALFTHPVSVLLFVPVVLGVLWLRGLRGVLRIGAIPELLVPVAGILATLLLKALGQPGQLEALAEARPYLALSLNAVQGFQPLAPFFLTPEKLPLSILALAGFLLVTVLALRRGFTASRRRAEGFFRTPAYLYILLGVTLLEMIFLVGPTWRDSRYLFMVEPFFFLLAAWSLVEILAWIWRQTRREFPSGWWNRLGSGVVSWAVTCLLVLGACLLFAPSARAAVTEQEWGYDLAFEYLASQWREGDTLLTIVPYACPLYLPQCDYYASGRSYEEYVFKKEGLLIDRWVGSRLVTSASELGDVVREHSRTWLVVDGWRLAARFDLEFIRTVAEQMDVVYEAQGVRVLLAEGYRTLAEPEIMGSVSARFEDQIELTGYELSGDEQSPGSSIGLTLFWRALQPVKGELTVFVHLTGRDDSLLAQDDYPPLKNLYPTYYWAEGQIVPDPRTLSIPREAAPGWYRLEVGVYSPTTRERLAVTSEDAADDTDFVDVDYVMILGETDGGPARTTAANLGGQIVLLGDGGIPAQLSPGEELALTLYWQAAEKMDEQYTTFVHLLGPEGQVVAQYDGQPLGGFYPTSQWDVGDVVRDEVSLIVGPSVPAGEYELMAGMYILSTGERLQVLDPGGETAGDAVVLGKVVVQGE
jgi:4-amino-4-deoxy-L-arabinose transferase-like glycosyltransferase